MSDMSLTTKRKRSSSKTRTANKKVKKESLNSCPHEDVISLAVSSLVDRVISCVPHFAHHDMDNLLEKINSQLNNRFNPVKKSNRFRDLPQGK